MAKNTITIYNLVEVKASYLLNKDKSLEILAEDAPTPKGRLPVLNPLVTSTYVKEGNLVKPVEKLQEGQKPYEFPDVFTVYM